VSGAKIFAFAVVSLPMRDGNLHPRVGIEFIFDVVSLPMRDGNGVQRRTVVGA